MVFVPPTIFHDYELHKTHWDSLDSSSQSSNYTPENYTSTSTPSLSSPSPPPSPRTRGFGKGPIPWAQGGQGSPSRTHLQVIREKEKKMIRRRSGVKPKAKTPRTHGAPNVGDTSSSNTYLEMVECQWAGCTKRLHVDYVSVKHWGQHIRDHYVGKPQMIQCQWDGGCGATVHKSSLWKHIVVHQQKFKIRCPHGCDVFTRGDMMKRHFQTCPFTSRAKWEIDEEDELQNEDGSHSDDYDGDDENSQRRKRK
jgi:hypothetical protein